MRGVSLVGVSVLLAACSGDHGVSLGVTAPAGVTTVELMIAPHRCQDTLGNEACKQAAGVVWDTAKAPHDGEVFIQNTDQVLAATVEGGVAQFHIESQAGEDYADRIVVVGYDEQQQAVAFAMLSGVTVPIHKAVEWRVTLRPLPDISEDKPGESVHIWKPQDRGRTCVAYERDDGSFEYVVPGEDADCDDAVPECNDFWWHFKPDANNANGACFAGGPSESSPCLLGVNGCADGKAGGDVCAPISPRTCATDAFCAACDTINTQCLENAVAGTDGIVIRCNFPTDVTGMPCVANSDMNLPANDVGYVDAFDQILSTLGTSCDTPRFIEPKLPLQPSGTILTPSGAKFSISKSDGACQLAIRWDASPGGIPLPMQPEHEIVDLQLAGAGQHILVPIEFTYVTDALCPDADQTAQICTAHNLTPDAAIFACAM